MNFIKTEKLIDGLVLSAVCAVSLLYSMYFSDFAEMHVRFSFLDFPIFIGEVLLAFCGCLLLFKLCLKRMREKFVLTPWHYVFIAYSIWVLAKALHGYMVWGPLALRNAALFYYPAFLFITYSTFSGKISDSFKFMALALLSVLYLMGPVHGYFVMAYILLTAILYIRLQNKFLKIIGLPFVLSVVFFSAQKIFGESRSHLVAALSTLFYISVVFYLLFRTRMSVKVQFVIFLIVSMLCGFGLWNYADRNGLKTLVSPVEIFTRYKEKLEYIREREGEFEFQQIQPKLYSDNSSGKVVSMHTGTLLNHQFTASLVMYDASKILTETAEYDLENIEPAVHVRAKPADPEGGPSEQPDLKQYRPLDSAFGNCVFRLLIWHDMLEQLWDEKAILGINFGKPQRSKSIEITQWAYGVWSKDGYITPHNSFLHVIYRAGIIGAGLLALFLWQLAEMAKIFLRERSVTGCLLMGVLIYWMVLANFLVILELPYFAIPFWSIFGITFAHYHQLKISNLNENTSHT